MTNVPSFQVDHTKMKPGIYLSRTKFVPPCGFVMVWDLRFVHPKGSTDEFKPLSSATLHTIEHLFASYLREAFGYHYVSFNPMGCKTGFYLETSALVTKKFVVQKLMEVIEFLLPICSSKEIPGLSKEECGNPNLFCVGAANDALSNYYHVLQDQLCESSL